MKISPLVMCLLLLLSASSNAQEIDKSLFEGYGAAFVMHDRSSGTVINVDPAVSIRRFPPCSTFKIYNTLIGLELGLLKGPDDPWYKWDGVQRDIKGWNRDLTLREAFRVSAVPAFQGLARKIGAKPMKKFIDDIGYGNRDISAGVDVFWLTRPGNAPILISADEQVALLNGLLDGKLPFAKENIAVLRDVMQVVKTEKGTLFGKTGTGRNIEGGGGLGWFVGFVESQGKAYVFACNITGGKDPSGKTARTVVENILKSRGIL